MNINLRFAPFAVCFLTVSLCFAADEDSATRAKPSTESQASVATPESPATPAATDTSTSTDSKAPTETKTAAESNSSQPLAWLESYSAGMKQATAEKKLMLIHFFRPEDQKRPEAATAVDSVLNIEKCLQEPGIREKLEEYVLVKLPVEAQINSHGETIRLLSHKAFAELRNGPGIAVIDFEHPDAEYHGFVVSVLPFTPGKYYRFRPSQLTKLFDLPPGSLTQRSMILAVRIHPEQPASTTGEEDPILLSEASSQSNYQAQIHLQGHHNWDTRFQRIIGKLFRRGTPGTPVEVVAESWPNQDLMDSCVDCVDSWHHSEGHWNAVKAQQASYGYDIRLSDNGIWYATGIFRPKE